MPPGRPLKYKDDPTVSLHIVVPASLRARLKRIAQSRQQSCSEIVTRLLKYLKEN